ncbi:alpha/beta hydrolase [Streptomyces liangshanensis]|uniref:alpha/beta hydrolase n=1 Tax=Streptomyces liangshanensis TaxID=2717324 RepID=UPI0036DE2CA6
MDAPLDPELAAWVGEVPATDLRDVRAARELERRTLERLPPYEPGRRLTVTDIALPGPRRGAPAPGVTARVYAPAGRTGPLPGLLYLHGGGFALGGVASVDSPARRLADRADVVVVNVRFRLAPEHPYPAALDDCYAALEWAAGPGGEAYGIDPARIGVLGESTGGGLAAALALLARDRGGPRLAAQFLDAPVLDDRLDSVSMRTIADATLWQAANQPLVWSYYLSGTAEPGSVDVPLYAAPARAWPTDLTGLPPAGVTTYQIDPVRDEGLGYALHLIEAGVPTEVHHYGTAFHLAHALPGTAIGARIHADRVSAIHRQLTTPPPTPTT